MFTFLKKTLSGTNSEKACKITKNIFLTIFYNK